MASTEALLALIDKRTELLTSAESSPALRDQLLAQCRDDLLFFVTWFVWTYDDRTSLKRLPFVPYPFQVAYFRTLTDYVERGRDLLTEKSRDMGASWMLTAFFFWRWRFHHDSFLIGSRKETLVDKPGDLNSHFERLRYIRRNLPPWMLPQGYDPRVHETYMKLQDPVSGATITGEATNDNFSRQGRYKAIMLDEYAFIEHPEQIWRACGDSTKCRLPVSTPNGKQNFFGRLRFSGQIDVSTLHWSQHPHKTPAWHETEALRRPAQDLAREVDLSYEPPAGKPFYGDSYVSDGPFAHYRELVVPKPEDLQWVILRGWDFGYHRPVCVFTALDVLDRWLWLYCIMGYDVLLEPFRDHVISATKLLFGNARCLDYADDAGRQKSDKSEKTCLDILAERGLQAVTRPSNDPEASYASRKRILQGKLRTIIGPMPGLVINKTWESFVPEGLGRQRGFVYGTMLLHEAMKGGYAYPELRENRPEDETPHKDGYYDHSMNAMEYIAVNHFTSQSDLGELPSFDHIAAAV